jgi:hypothetical protein
VWFCFNNSFISVVQDQQDKDVLLVRGRQREHLKVLFPEYNPVETPTNDYRWRIFIPKRDFQEFISRKVSEIDYGNFKASTLDPDLHEMYSSWWVDHWMLQQKAHWTSDLQKRKSAPQPQGGEGFRRKKKGRG